MILANAFYSGLIGAGGALFCTLVWFLYLYYKSLFKKYRVFVKEKNIESIKFWEVIIFGIISFVVGWIIFFGIFCSAFNWRTLSAEGSALLAFFIAILIPVFLMLPYLKRIKN